MPRLPQFRVNRFKALLGLGGLIYATALCSRVDKIGISDFIASGSEGDRPVPTNICPVNRIEVNGVPKGMGTAEACRIAFDTDEFLQNCAENGVFWPDGRHIKPYDRKDPKPEYTIHPGDAVCVDPKSR